MSDLPKDMRTVYDTAVEPGIRARTGKSPQDARAVRKAMQPVTFYRTWSSLRYNAQGHDLEFRARRSGTGVALN